MASDVGGSRELPLRGRVCLTVAAVCAAFAAIASWVVLGYYAFGAFSEAGAFGWRLYLKALFFTCCAVACVAGILRTSNAAAVTSRTSPDRPPPNWFSRAVLMGGMALAAILFFPRLSRFPWPAPDELHHLIVARNLAQFGAYASGLPPDGLVYFDHYDSVGPPVIGPIALAFIVFGAKLAIARAVIAIFGIALVPLMYSVLRPVFSPAQAVAGALIPLAAFGTIYLARSLYGEIPAFVYLLSGLLLWRLGLPRRPHRTGLLLLAGAFLGLCVLSKAFMLVSAFAFLGVWLYDRATFRRIDPRAIWLPGAGLIAVLAAWQLFVTLAGPAASEQPSTILYYRHSLVFGIDAFLDSFGQWLRWSPTVLVAVMALWHAAPLVFGTRYDPALAVVFLLAPLFAFWWLFFTPHHIERYLWYSGVIVAMFVPPLVTTCVQMARRVTVAPMYRRWASVAAVLLIVYAYAPRFVEKASYVYSNDQAADERALAAYVDGLPRSLTIATTYWPTERLINFTAQRPVDVISGERVENRQYDVLIESDRIVDSPPARAIPERRFGHYRVYRNASYREAEHRGDMR